MSRTLNAEKVIKTISTLQDRINERFPDSGLSHVCGELVTVANESKERAIWIAEPNIILRIFIALVILTSLTVLVYSSRYLHVTTNNFSLGELIQVLEASINTLVLVGAALFFLVTFERRIKRGRALTALYELRSIAHVIDMHQLTKDPNKLTEKLSSTAASPIIKMNAFELARYLDYSSEMLSLVGKVAAIYSENIMDDVVVSAVNEIENLTTGLCRKIWQKIMIVNTF